MVMKSKPSAVYRCDLLSHDMNRGKQDRVVALLYRWREVAVLIGREQWRLFYVSGAINGRSYGPAGVGLLGTNHRQMIYAQVAGILSSWLSNRQNEYRDIVQGSALPSYLKHQLHVINRLKAWHRPGALTMQDGTPIPSEVRRLARRIFARACRRHRRPDLSRINMLIDQRAIAVTPVKAASAFPLWARLSTLEKGAPIWVPLKANAHYARRHGRRALTVQVNQTSEGELRIGILTDVAEALAVSRAAYQPRTQVIALDLGLKTLFGTSEGDLLGRGWMTRIEKLDRQITRLAAHRQRMLRAELKIQHGKGTRVTSPRYRRLVARLRGFIASEVNRILNRLIADRAPATLVVEHLRFRSPGLSKRMNRLLSIFGKSAIEAKLKALHEVFGIQVESLNAAYSSQECSTCHYVDKTNRNEQAAFACRWCGHTLHADVNAARVLRYRRSVPALSVPALHRREILDTLVRQHVQRFTRLRAGPADPRRSNPYFREWLASVTSIAEAG